MTVQAINGGCFHGLELWTDRLFPGAPVNKPPREATLRIPLTPHSGILDALLASCGREVSESVGTGTQKERRSVDRQGSSDTRRGVPRARLSDRPTRPYSLEEAR